jgi:hypothetical protein
MIAIAMKGDPLHRRSGTLHCRASQQLPSPMQPMRLPPCDLSGGIDRLHLTSQPSLSSPLSA